jgi:hypothetical protein
MPSKEELETEYIKFNDQREKKGKPRLAFKHWYKKRFETEPPHFVDALFSENEVDVDQYLRSVLGREPYVNNAKRRWRFLWSFSRFVYEKKALNFVTVVRWFARNGEVMKPRTIKESYIEYLETLGVIEWNENTKIVKWKGEVPEFD